MRIISGSGRRCLLVLLLLTALLAACGTDDPDPVDAADPGDDAADDDDADDDDADDDDADDDADEEPEASIEFNATFATSSAIGFADVPLLIALDALRDDNTGVDVEVIEFGDTATSTQALVQGDVDIAIINVPGLTAANNQGAGLLTFFNGKNNEWHLASSVDITDPSELDGMRVAHHGVGLTEALALLVEQEYGVSPQFLAVPGSDNRVQALIEGQIDAAPVDVSGLVLLEMLAPGEFHSLIRYDDITELIATHMTASASALQENPEGWTTLVKYLACVRRKATDEPEWLAAKAVQYMSHLEPSESELSAQANADERVLRDGPMSADEYDAMMSFYVDSGLVEADEVLEYEDFMFSDYVDAAFADIDANGCPDLP